MQKQFHLFIRHHFNDWFTASILTHPEYAVYGPKTAKLKEELSAVVARELATKHLIVHEDTHFEDLRHRSLRLEIKAVQNNRLITVPMRFTVLSRPLDKELELYEVRIPRLHKVFNIVGEENISPWAEESIRGYFHLQEVTSLLRFQYEKNEKVESLDVVYHGPGRYKIKKERSFEEEWELLRHRTELESVGVNLTEEAKEGRLQRAHFRDEAIEQLTTVLASKQSRSVLLLGPSGVGKTALLHEVITRIANNEKIPPQLEYTPVWQVTGSRIIAGMKYLGQWQERCLTIIRQVRADVGILYVDSLLELLLSGSTKSGLNVAQFLLPYIQSGELTVIAETTPDALTLAERLNPPFIQALRKLPVNALPLEHTFQLLERSAKRLGKEHRVDFTKPSINRALEILARFGDADALPGSGLDLIEQMARLSPPDTQRRTLQPIDAIKAFSNTSGFPEALINPDQLLDVQAVRKFFKDRVIGQNHAMELMTNLVMLVKASLNDPQKPLGSFLFMGPTGVGKTEAALTLAEYLFNDRKRLIRLDMSEYAYPGSAIRLVGTNNSEGDLTRKVRETPFCIVLLDEVEKADPSVFDVLLQVLGEGRLTDATGQTVRFTHTIVIMTSNLGASRKPSLGFAQQTKGDLEHHYMDAAEKYFRPEFINRIDFIVPFHDLSKESLRAISKRMLDAAVQREGFKRRGLTIRYEDDILDFLMKVGFDPKYGARPMKRAVDQHILIPLSRRLIRRTEQSNSHFELYLHDNRIAMVSEQPLQGQPAPPLEEITLQHDQLWSRYLSQHRLRLEEWEETKLIQHLRSQQQTHFPSRIEALSKQLNQLELLSQRHPSQLPDETKTLLKEQCLALDELTRQLEWDLCLSWLPSTDSFSFTLEVISLNPIGLRLIDLLIEQYELWGETHKLTLHITEEETQTHLHFLGPHAQLLLKHELGIHRVIIEENDPIDIWAYIQRPSPETPPPTVREYSETPETLWDPDTEWEVKSPWDQLHLHLNTFVLHRMCTQITKNPPPTPKEPA